MRSIAGFFLSLTLLHSAAVLAAGELEPGVESKLSELSLDEIDRRLNNPLADIWSLTFQNNTGIHEGDTIDGSEYSNNLFFQPFMPFELGESKSTMLTLRPVFPLVTQPVFDAEEPARSLKHTTGFGDMQILGLAGPNRGEGLIWGAGATLKLPTAGNDLLGQGKYQAGPAAMLFYLGKPWVGGVLLQHWSSFAGDDERADTSRTDIQYVVRRSIPGAMSIGMGPQFPLTGRPTRTIVSLCRWDWASPRPFAVVGCRSSCGPRRITRSSPPTTTGPRGTSVCR